MKNRVMDQEIVLSPGKYVVTFVTDESHSYGNWNRLPPFDPAHWGITLWGLDEDFDKDLAVISLIPENGANKIVDITRVGNDRFETYGFTLKKKTTIRVHCLGEYGRKDRFADYGWLLDAGTREHVWKMDVKDSRHAGGAGKNRIAISTLTLDPGSYEACYITDDSHAYKKWNAGPPYNPEAWGITIFVVDDDFDPETVRSYDEQDDPSMLVQVIRMEDNERLRRRFQLEESAQIRVYAVGEGDDNKMYDYGWIEDDNGRCVWKMEYQDTEHAGGARKNRMVNHVIVLSQGQYTVYFRTDGSHSFEEWNDDPPADPVHWGITVRREQRTEMD
ncbi:hypothetical protein KA005_48185, partial [bacterium]|nr:hypothetical protein [bacterium]